MGRKEDVVEVVEGIPEVLNSHLEPDPPFPGLDPDHILILVMLSITRHLT